MSSSANTTSCVYGEIWIDGFARLHTGDESTSSPSSNTLQEFRDGWLAAAKRQLSIRPKSPSPEERMKRRQERKRKGLVIALNTYAKRNNMQLTELEFVKEKERNQVDGCAALYVHSNFLVKDSDGKHTMFFAEMRPDCTREEDVVLCTPLEENNYVIVSGAMIEQRSLGIPRAVATWVDIMRCFFTWRSWTVMMTILCNERNLIYPPTQSHKLICLVLVYHMLKV